MFVGAIVCDLLLGDVHSLKQKRALVRPIVAEAKRRFSVSVAETGHQDLYRRAEVGAAVVASDAGHCTEVLDEIENWVAARPEIELLSVRRTLTSTDDD